jgi:arabinose-5-phosphate isomerase
LGRVTPSDVVLALSNSGKSEEILRIIPSLKRIGAVVVAITGQSSSPLAREADLAVEIGLIDEACPMGLVPTASSAALHAVCDAISITVLQNRPITNERYALFHPGGALGRQVARVYEVMRAGAANPVVFQGEPLHRAVAVMTNTPGRPGVTSVVDSEGKLAGVFTDGDLRRLVERGSQDFSIELSTVMCKNPKTCFADELVYEAAARMREGRVDQLPVIDREERPIGLLDVQDLLAARFL